ncbi:MAG TPA: hypothetical protein VHQ90_04525 [Thermoanaerobaculia bacterium]|nr:hypothetical protein [Thermoanaerobaculia bacterium]
MEIAFLTLFLGLTTGAGPVALSAGPAVVAVELLLDGKTVARLEKPPWSAEVDFGMDLLPHHLVARGLGLGDREVARAEQWINLPRPAAEVEIVVEKAEAGRPRVARLTWQSLTNERPLAFSLTLDGQPLELDRENRSILPELAGSGPGHVLSATLRFAHGVVARKDVVLGAEYGEEIATELTAVAVRPRQGGALPPAGQLQDWFRADGKALRVSAVEVGPPHIFAVRAPGVTRNSMMAPWSILRRYQFILQRGSRMRFVATRVRDRLAPHAHRRAGEKDGADRRCGGRRGAASRRRGRPQGRAPGPRRRRQGREPSRPAGGQALSGSHPRTALRLVRR